MSRIAAVSLSCMAVLLFSAPGFSQPQEREAQATETLQNTEAVQEGAADREGSGVQSRDRAQSPDRDGGQSINNHQHGKNKGGKGSPNVAGKSGPAGSKNKSQKQGR